MTADSAPQDPHEHGEHREYDRQPPRRPATEEEARALASALRLRILRVTLDEALTNKEIAERLGRNPASILHHVRRLVDTGFLVPEEERRGRRGAREVPYRATGKSWTLDVADHDVAAASEAAVGAFVDEVRHLDHSTTFTSRLVVRLGEDGLREFQGRIQAVLDEYGARSAEQEEGKRYAVFFTVYPHRP